MKRASITQFQNNYIPQSVYGGFLLCPAIVGHWENKIQRTIIRHDIRPHVLKGEYEESVELDSNNPDRIILSMIHRESKTVLLKESFSRNSFPWEQFS